MQFSTKSARTKCTKETGTDSTFEGTRTHKVTNDNSNDWDSYEQSQVTDDTIYIFPKKII